MIKKITNFLVAYCLVFLMCFCTLSFVSSSSADNNAGIGNSSNKINNDSKAYSYSDADSHSYAKTNSGSTISDAGDEIISVEYPAAASTSDKEERSIHALWGGINNNVTEEHKRLQHQAQMAQSLYQARASFLLHRMKNIDRNEPAEDYLEQRKEIIVSLELAKEEYVLELEKIYVQIDESNQPGKFLGLFQWNNRSCNVLNACGLLVIK